MRRSVVVAASTVALIYAGTSFQPATAASPDFIQAQNAFESEFSVEQRILAQILLIAAGYDNAVPVEHFNGRVMKSLQDFQVANGFEPNGRLDKVQVDRLVSLGNAKLDLWGFRRVSFPSRPLSIWAPLGLGLDMKQTASGLHFKDREGRLWLDLVSVPAKSVDDVYRELLAQTDRHGSTIHWKALKDGWFVISATTADSHDHYYRYHQDGDAVTGFALEWDNAAGNINAERIATIMSGSLWAGMTGAPFIEPPAPSTQARADAQPQPVAVPVTPPPPAPAPKTAMSGTGFFVAADGAFITNAHVIDGCPSIEVKTPDGMAHGASRIAMDGQNDLALLRVPTTPARVAALRIGARLGEGVEAFGFPHSELLSTSGNFTEGNVTALSGVRDDSRYLQISAPVQAGNSGGPLLDRSGNLIGVVSAKLDAMKVAASDGDLPQNVNFAVKSDMLATFLDANRVAFKIGTPAGKPLDPADIADQARAMSGFVTCRSHW